MKSKSKVLILGGGFAGVETARQLEKMLSPNEAELQLVSRDNFVLFTPMLHEIAASDLDITTIVNPVRKMIRRTRFMQADIQAIDLNSRHGSPYPPVGLRPSRGRHGRGAEFLWHEGYRGACYDDEVS